MKMKLYLQPIDRPQHHQNLGLLVLLPETVYERSASNDRCPECDLASSIKVALMPILPGLLALLLYNWCLLSINLEGSVDNDHSSAC